MVVLDTTGRDCSIAAAHRLSLLFDGTGAPSDDYWMMCEARHQVPMFDDHDALGLAPEQICMLPKVLA